MKKKIIAALLCALLIVDTASAAEVSASAKTASTAEFSASTEAALAAGPGEAAESVSAADVSTGPLYWMAYETPFETDSYLKEDRWDANVDWLTEEGFVDAGYDMMSTDGWIEGAQAINENGYITKYNYSWTKTWKDMGDQLKAKGMKLGVYYDPLWVTAAAYNSTAKIAGTEIPVRSLVNTELGHFSDFKKQALPQGEGFDGEHWCQVGEPALYWLDTDKEGAEQYIKGYVKHFADAGASFLRVDFLGWYENGINGDNNQNGKPAYGTERYEKALKWMREACDAYGVTLSLVMPNQYNHAATELKYGHMMRVNEDVANGGWDNSYKGPEPGWTNDHISGRRRGQWQENWAQWGNSFDAFTGWADVGGRGQIILDGDFLRMARFDVIRTDDNTDTPISTDEELKAADAQKRSAVSLAAMAGSPICIADQYDTMNQNAPAGVDNKIYYLNKEILALNQAGFVGKPMGLGESERWAGQLPDGSWVVALFNRDRETKTQKLDFKKDLGITGTASVRELWQHKSYGRLDHFSVELAACDCVVLKIKPETVRYEAEVASLRTGAKSNRNHSNFSGWGFSDKLENSSGDVLFAVNAEGSQNIQIRYCNGSAEAAPVAEVWVNGTKVQDVSLPSTGNWDTWDTATVENVAFEPGENLVNIKCASEAGFNLDYIEIGSAGPEPEEKIYITCEAEGADIGSGAKEATDHQLAYGDAFVDSLDSPHWNGSSDTLKFRFQVEKAGDYDLSFRYANGGGDATADVFVNDQKLGYFTFPAVYGGAWDAWGTVTLFEKQEGGQEIAIEKVTLKPGVNTVEYKHGDGAVNMDRLTITPHEDSAAAGSSVEYVQSLEDITAQVGAEFSSLNLPSQVNVKISGEEQEKAVNVAWQESDINLNKPGAYILKGTLSLDGALANSAVAAEIRVVVEDKITGVSEIQGISAAAGTSFENLELPETVEVTLGGGTTDTLKVKWSKGDYDSRTPGTYTLSGSLTLKEGVANPDQVKPSIAVTVKEGLKILEVKNPEAIEAAFGTSFKDLSLPKTAEVTLSDNQTKTLQVTWSQGTYDGQTAGTYRLKGDLELVEEIVNPDSRQAEIEVTVKEKNQEVQEDKKIQSVQELEGITAAYGTSFESLTLPQTAEVTLEDGTKESLSITWNPGIYDGQTAGTYNLTGELVLKEGVVNPDGKQAEIAVTVKEKNQELQEGKKIQSVQELEGITAAHGTSFESLTLPQTAEVTLEDGTKESLSITWNPGTYDGQTAGTYNLTGELTLKEGIVNPDGKQAAIAVKVEAGQTPGGNQTPGGSGSNQEKPGVPQSVKKIAAVEELAEIETVIGTSFDKLALPKTASVTLEGGTKDSLGVVWDPETYDGQTAGSYILNGDLTLKEGIANPNGLEAQIKVTVKAEISVKNGKVYTAGSYKYKVTSVSKKTVTISGSKKKDIKKIVIPDTVKLGGASYKVTAVGNNAFKNCKKATSIKVGKNITSIGNNAFYGCVKVKTASLNSKKLKTIGAKAFYNCKMLMKVTIKSTVLKKVGSKAFTKTSKKITVKTPKNKKSAYRKLLKNKGLSKKAKIIS